ncbi:MAG: hypothetical protein M9944_21815 [Rhizobiaceae bacterium]|nr:hypothetical protein [Rhizobiaceae bacterium]
MIPRPSNTAPLLNGADSDSKTGAWLADTVRTIPGSLLFDLPIGTLIRFSDHIPEPPANRQGDLAVWRLFNGIGRLARRDPPHFSPLAHPASITIRTADFGERGAVGFTFALGEPSTAAMRFEVLELPPVGSVRILARDGDNAELLHLAEDEGAAVAWLARHPVSTVIFDPVTADEIAAMLVEGR